MPFYSRVLSPSNALILRKIRTFEVFKSHRADFKVSKFAILILLKMLHQSKVSFYQTNCSISRFHEYVFRLVHVVLQFSSMESTIFFGYSNSWFEDSWDWTLLEHDLETFQRPWSTWVVTPWAFQGPKNWKWSIKNYRTFVITSMDENCRTTWTSLMKRLYCKNQWTCKFKIVIWVEAVWRSSFQ